MKKDGMVKPGSTRCDFCDAPSVGHVGAFVVCARHLHSGEKTAADNPSLKAAGLSLRNAHK